MAKRDNRIYFGVVAITAHILFIIWLSHWECAPTWLSSSRAHTCTHHITRLTDYTNRRCADCSNKNVECVYCLKQIMVPCTWPEYRSWSFRWKLLVDFAKKIRSASTYEHDVDKFNRFFVACATFSISQSSKCDVMKPQLVKCPSGNFLCWCRKWKRFSSMSGSQSLATYKINGKKRLTYQSERVTLSSKHQISFRVKFLLTQVFLPTTKTNVSKCITIMLSDDMNCWLSVHIKSQAVIMRLSVFLEEHFALY